MIPRVTNTSMSRAVSAITTRSHASTRLAPPPAAVPFTAAIDRLLAVEDRGDEPLPAAADQPGHVAEGPVGRVVGPRRLGLLGAAEAGARAEVLLAGTGEDDGPHAERGRQLVEDVGEVVAHVGGERVARVGSVERDAGDRHRRARRGSAR